MENGWDITLPPWNSTWNIEALHVSISLYFHFSTNNTSCCHQRGFPGHKSKNIKNMHRGMWYHDDVVVKSVVSSPIDIFCYFFDMKLETEVNNVDSRLWFRRISYYEQNNVRDVGESIGWGYDGMSILVVLDYKLLKEKERKKEINSVY